ncbi:MAG: hypothetical protein K2Q22_06145, partial [Cytophagales bacterium]|nr:hypothetical protein [Cytophagales bacterium]
TASITSNLLYLAYPSKDTIYIANATDLWFSYNAGASWAKSTTTLAGGTIQSITFINGQKGFLTSGNSYLLGTNDGGTSWQILEHSLYSSSIYSIALSPYTNKGMFFGSVYGGRTNSSGQSWYSSNADNQVLLSYTHAQYISNSIVYANHKSYNGIARSEDNGFTWQTESTREWAASSYSSFHFSDSNYGYLITKYQIQSKKDQGPSTVTNVDEGTVKSDVQNISNLKTGIFPNPAKDKITVEPKSDKYIILNSLGQEILSSSSNPIDISSLENGLYFVGNGISPMVKFIKE